MHLEKGLNVSNREKTIIIVRNPWAGSAHRNKNDLDFRKRRKWARSVPHMHTMHRGASHYHKRTQPTDRYTDRYTSHCIIIIYNNVVSAALYIAPAALYAREDDDVNYCSRSSTFPTLTGDRSYLLPAAVKLPSSSSYRRIRLNNNLYIILLCVCVRLGERLYRERAV